MNTKLVGLVIVGVIGLTLGTVVVSKFKAKRFTPSKYLTRKELE